MGKRRARNLHVLGYRDIAGLDPRPDRREAARGAHVCEVFGRLDEALSAFRPDVALISSPPHTHMDLAENLVEARVPCFLEASVVEADRIAALADRAQSLGVVVCPSSTMRYFPGPRKVRELLAQEAVGRPLLVHYHTGQYLPDWHPWESIQDYYVSKRETGGCREIVPFELIWLNEIFGSPHPIACHYGKTGTLDADIDDIYHMVLQYGQDGPLLSLSVEVLSRPVATREMRIVGTKGILVFSQDEACVRITQNGTNGAWQKFTWDTGTVHSRSINPEEPYVEELRDFLSAVREKASGKFPHSLARDAETLRLLGQLEALRGPPR